MLMKYSLFFFGLIVGFSAWATDENNYSVFNIPKELLKNANVIKRYEEIKFQIISLERSKGYKKVAFTILNENAERYATMYESYNRQHTIKSFEGNYLMLPEKK